MRGEARAHQAREAKWTGQPLPEQVHHVPTWRWRKAEAARLRKEQLALDAREARLDKRAADLDTATEAVQHQRADADVIAAQAKAETVAAKQKAEEADAVIAVAEGIAEGVYELRDQDDKTKLILTQKAKAAGADAPYVARAKASWKGHGRGLDALRKSWSALRRRAKADAEERLRTEFEEVEATRGALMEVVKALPENVRESLGTSWKSVAKRVVSVRQMLRKRGQSEVAQDRAGRGTPEDQKKDSNGDNDFR